jgi:hypothetical protein
MIRLSCFFFLFGILSIDGGPQTDTILQDFFTRFKRTCWRFSDMPGMAGNNSINGNFQMADGECTISRVIEGRLSGCGWHWERRFFLFFHILGLDGVAGLAAGVVLFTRSHL